MYPVHVLLLRHYHFTWLYALFKNEYLQFHFFLQFITILKNISFLSMVALSSYLRILSDNQASVYRFVCVADGQSKIIDLYYYYYLFLSTD